MSFKQVASTRRSVRPAEDNVRVDLWSAVGLQRNVADQ
jgi:hypothetical protein